MRSDAQDVMTMSEIKKKRKKEKRKTRKFVIQKEIKVNSENTGSTWIAIEKRG